MKETLKSDTDSPVKKLRTLFLNRTLPGEKASFCFSISVAKKITKIEVQKGVIEEISESPESHSSSGIVFTVDPLCFDEIITGRLQLHKAFSKGKVKIRGGVLKAIGLAAKFQNLINTAAPDTPTAENSVQQTEKVICEEELFSTVTPEGTALTARVSYSEAVHTPSAVHIIFPPDPLLGGNSTNKVITALAEASLKRDMISVAIDYRGVTESGLTDEKSFAEWEKMSSDKKYEKVANDAIFIIKQIHTAFAPEAPLYFSGFSFGAYIALACSASSSLIKPEKLAAIAPPLGDLPFLKAADNIDEIPDILIITPEHDEFCTDSDIAEFIEISSRKQMLSGSDNSYNIKREDNSDTSTAGTHSQCKTKVIKVDADSHFMHGVEKEAAEKIMEYFL